MEWKRQGKGLVYSGRIGNVITYNWRGRQCVRTMPSQYNDARSEPQLRQRAMFRAGVQFASKARNVLKIGLKAASLNAQMTECNYFMRINKGCFLGLSDDETPVLEIDYENLVLSEGPVAPVAFEAPRLLDDTTVSIDYEQNPLRRAVKPYDLVYLVAYCPEFGHFDISAPSLRRHNHLEMSLNPAWAGKEVHLWGFVADAEGRASYSQYIGCGILSVDSFNDSAEESGPAISETPETQSISASESSVYHSTSSGDAPGEVAVPPPKREQ